MDAFATYDGDDVVDRDAALSSSEAADGDADMFEGGDVVDGDAAVGDACASC